MFNEIQKHFHSNNLYYDNQYGIRENHSTELVTLEIMDRIVQELDQSATPLNIYLDLSKAFDTIDHNILLHKLNYFGINGATLDLCNNYLYNRKQYVEVGDFKSEEAKITIGFPQGAILGPLLFIIYINDIALSSDFFKFIIFL